jgi:ABC-type sulfate transport system permease subunit
MVEINENGYNLFAILALIFAFVALPVGLILGIIALSQIKKTGEKGRWMAWVPIAISIGILALIILGIMWVVLANIIA